MNIEGTLIKWITLDPDGEVKGFLHTPEYHAGMETWLTDGKLSEDFYVTMELGECEVRKKIGLYNVDGDTSCEYDKMPEQLEHFIKDILDGKTDSLY